MEGRQTRERDVDVYNIVDFALDQSAEVTLPALRTWCPRAAVGVVPIIRDGDDRVQLEADGLDEVVVGRRVGVPCWAEHDVYAPKEIGNAAGLEQLAADEHGQVAPRRANHGSRELLLR